MVTKPFLFCLSDMSKSAKISYYCELLLELTHARILLGKKESERERERKRERERESERDRQTHTHTQVIWWFMPCQPVELYQGKERVREVLYKEKL